MDIFRSVVAALVVASIPMAASPQDFSTATGSAMVGSMTQEILPESAFEPQSGEEMEMDSTQTPTFQIESSEEITETYDI